MCRSIAPSDPIPEPWRVCFFKQETLEAFFLHSFAYRWRQAFYPYLLLMEILGISFGQHHFWDSICSYSHHLNSRCQEHQYFPLAIGPSDLSLTLEICHEVLCTPHSWFDLEIACSAGHCRLSLSSRGFRALIGFSLEAIGVKTVGKVVFFNPKIQVIKKCDPAGGVREHNLKLKRLNLPLLDSS